MQSIFNLDEKTSIKYSHKEKNNLKQRLACGHTTCDGGGKSVAYDNLPDINVYVKCKTESNEKKTHIQIGTGLVYLKEAVVYEEAVDLSL